MSRADFCDGCGWLDFEDQANRYDVFTALCCDTEKPMPGARRVVAASGTGRPRYILRPVWCRGKRGGEESHGIDP